VQVAVPVGAKTPKAWANVPITPISMRTFSLEGVEDDERHGVTVRLATPERVLVDAGALPGRVGGPQGLARIASRAAPTADWDRVVKLAHKRSGGGAALRRLAAILELVGTDIPPPLSAAAATDSGTSYLYLGERRLHGTHGRRLRDWAIVDNVGAEILREEIER